MAEAGKTNDTNRDTNHVLISLQDPEEKRSLKMDVHDGGTDRAWRGIVGVKTDTTDPKNAKGPGEESPGPFVPSCFVCFVYFVPYAYQLIRDTNWMTRDVFVPVNPVTR